MEPEDMDLLLDMAKVGVINLELEGEGAHGEKLNNFWNSAESQASAYDDLVKDTGTMASAAPGSAKTLDALSEDELHGGEDVWSFDDSMLADVGGHMLYSVP